tara:strand:+ start:554 stop:1141 length:588 start_codon:yes stop_codon:yes gene_type:complete
MENVLLVSEQRMKQWTSLDNNIRIDVLTPSIISAQDIYIQDTLGTPFYKRLKEGVIANDLTTNESTFLKDYIGPCLIQYSLYLLLPSLKYKMVEAGIVNGTSEETQSTTLDELQYLRESAMDTAMFYNQRMLDFLKDNPNMFTLYANPTANDGMSPNKDTPYFSGLQTQIPIQRNDLYIYADCGLDCSPDCSSCN